MNRQRVKIISARWLPKMTHLWVSAPKFWKKLEKLKMRWKIRMKFPTFSRKVYWNFKMKNFWFFVLKLNFSWNNAKTLKKSLWAKKMEKLPKCQSVWYRVMLGMKTSKKLSTPVRRNFENGQILGLEISNLFWVISRELMKIAQIWFLHDFRNMAWFTKFLIILPY